MTERTRRPLLNYALGLMCAGVILAAFLVVGPASQSATTQERLAKAVQGVVQSTVSGSGTLSPASKVGVNFTTSGTLTGVFVKVGQHVKQGQLLAEVDPSNAQTSLRSAEMSLADAQASYQATLEGLTPVEVRQNDISAAQSRASVSTARQSLKETQESARSDAAASRNAVTQAEQSLKDTEQSVKLEATSQQDAVNEAIAQRASDEKALTEAEAQLEEAKSALASERSQPSPNPTKVSAAESRVSAGESAVKSAQAKVVQDNNSVTSAQNNQSASALKGQESIASARNTVANDKQNESASTLKDDQSIAQARTSVASAEESLKATLASNEAKAAPPTKATLLSAENSVKSAQLTVENAHKALSGTKLYAPTEGVVASIKSLVGETVSGTSTGSSSSETSTASGAGSTSTSSHSTGGSAGSTSGGTAGTSVASSGSTSTGTSSGGGSHSGAGDSVGGGSSANTGGGGAGTGRFGGGSGATGTAGSVSSTDGGTFHDIAAVSSSGSGGSSSGLGSSGSSGSSGEGSSSSGNSFIELVDVRGYQLVVPLSESEIIHVRVGQFATVTVEALEGRKFAATVVGIAVNSTSNSGVVSYDVTFQLEQTEPDLKPGMSATAEIVVNQEEGVNVPSSAVSGGSVTVVKNGTRVRRSVVTGLAGNTSTIILSGLSAGEEVALPTATSTSSATSLTSRLGARFGGGGLGGGFGGGGGGGGGAFFRGGG